MVCKPSIRSRRTVGPGLRRDCDPWRSAVIRPAGSDRGYRSCPASSGRHKAAIWRAFLEHHHVVVFPDQSLTREQQFAFAAQFGEVESHGAHRGESKPQTVAHVLSNLDAAGKPVFRISRAANYHWHTDKPYHPAPPLLTMLHAVELPPLRTAAATPNSPTWRWPMTRCRSNKRQIAGLRVAFRPAFDPEPARRRPSAGAHPSGDRPQVALSRQPRDAHRRTAPRESARLLPSCSRTRHSGDSFMPIAGSSAIS